MIMVILVMFPIVISVVWVAGRGVAVILVAGRWRMSYKLAGTSSHQFNVAVVGLFQTKLVGRVGIAVRVSQGLWKSTTQVIYYFDEESDELIWNWRNDLFWSQSIIIFTNNQIN